MTWRENVYQRRSPLISHLPYLPWSFLSDTLTQLGLVFSPLYFHPLHLLHFPWWLHEPFKMSFATILTCPSVAVLLDDFSVPKLPCLGFKLLRGSTPTFSLLYPFYSTVLPTLFFLKFHLFIFVLGCAGSLLLCRLFSGWGSGGCSLVCGAWTSDYSGFSRAPGLSSYGSQALEHRFNSCGTPL